MHSHSVIINVIIIYHIPTLQFLLNKTTFYQNFSSASSTPHPPIADSLQLHLPIIQGRTTQQEKKKKKKKKKKSSQTFPLTPAL